MSRSYILVLQTFLYFSYHLVLNMPAKCRRTEVGPLGCGWGVWRSARLPQWVRAEPGRQTLSGAFSAYLGTFWQTF